MVKILYIDKYHWNTNMTKNSTVQSDYSSAFPQNELFCEPYTVSHFILAVKSHLY